MSIQELGSLGELVAAIATVFTLVYLALQIRENTKIVRSEASRSIRSDGAATFRMIAGDAIVAELFNRGFTGARKP
jgi:hypothetical protein